jgi:hypothetical protein
VDSLQKIHSPSLKLPRREFVLLLSSFERIILSMSFAHLDTKGNNSMAYFTERVGIQEGIKQKLEAKLGRISVRRIPSPS